MFISFLQTTALILTIDAAIFLAYGNLSLTPRMIAEMSATIVGANPRVITSLSKQNANTWAGVILLISSFILQMIAMRIGLTQDELGVINTDGQIFGVIVGVVIFIVFIPITKIYSRSIEKQANAITIDKLD